MPNSQPLRVFLCHAKEVKLAEKAEEQKKAWAEVWHKINFKPFLAIGGILIAMLCLFGCGNYVINNLPATPTQTILTNTKSSTPTNTAANDPTKTATNLPMKAATNVSTETATTVPPTSTPTPKPGVTMLGADGATLVFVPAGEFTIGSEDGNIDEQPVHAVFLDSYWIDRTEVTNAMYAKCVETGDCRPPSNTSSYTRSSYYGNPEFDDYPVIYVNWYKAKTYCEWAGRRLPAETEWEKAARGTDGRTYPWGNDFDCKKGNFDDEIQLDNYVVPGGANCDGFPDTSPVGWFINGKSPYGAYDMVGNVWEWVNDWYDSAYYSSSPSSNPLGPVIGQSRVRRGGSWYDYYGDVRSGVRNGSDPGITDVNVGFRCARGTSP